MKLLMALFFMSPLAHAAPMPATSSSDLINSRPGLFTSALGFEMDAGTTNWVLAEVPKESKYIVTMYKAPKKEGAFQPSLTVRVDKLQNKSTLQKYVKKWLKEYPKFGFDVLGSQGFKMKGQTGYVVDLLHQEQKKQLRQVLFLRDQNAQVITCRDDAGHFKEALKSCNSIIRTFRWTSPSTPAVESKTQSL